MRLLPMLFPIITLAFPEVSHLQRSHFTNLSTAWTQLKKDFAVTPELEEITETCKDFITICTGELPILTVENQI